MSGKFNATENFEVQSCSQIFQKWQDRSLEFSALSDLARNMFCVMATGTAHERVFGMDGHAMNSRRANLQSSSMNDVFFVNSELKAETEAPKVE